MQDSNAKSARISLMKTMDIANKQEVLRLQSGMTKVSSPGTYSAEAPSDRNAIREQTVREASRSIKTRVQGGNSLWRLKITCVLQERPVLEGLS